MLLIDRCFLLQKSASSGSGQRLRFAGSSTAPLHHCCRTPSASRLLARDTPGKGKACTVVELSAQCRSISGVTQAPSSSLQQAVQNRNQGRCATPHICTNFLRVGTRLYIQSNPTDINRLLVCDVVLYGANLQRVLRAVRGGAAAATIAAES